MMLANVSLLLLIRSRLFHTIAYYDYAAVLLVHYSGGLSTPS